MLAHELSHVAHRDVAVMTIASFLRILAGLLTRALAYAGLFGGFGGAATGTRVEVAAGRPVSARLELGMLAFSALIYAISFVLIRTLSRYRELAADRSGAILIGQPRLLAQALVKVSGEMSRVPTRDCALPNTSTRSSSPRPSPRASASRACFRPTRLWSVDSSS